MKDRRLRLIHSGQLLTDTTLLYSRLTTQEDRQRRITPHGEEAESSPQAPISHAWLHCSIGPQLKEGEEDESKVQVSMYFIMIHLSSLRTTSNLLPLYYII